LASDTGNRILGGRGFVTAWITEVLPEIIIHLVIIAVIISHPG
jgi:hypothetical protein